MTILRLLSLLVFGDWDAFVAAPFFPDWEAFAAASFLSDWEAFVPVPFLAGPEDCVGTSLIGDDAVGCVCVVAGPELLLYVIGRKWE